VDLSLGPKLASGRDADVFDLGNGRVLRRHRNPHDSAEPQAAIMRFVREQRYPVPAVHAVTGPDMVLDRVDGRTMLADLMCRPWMVWRHARLLARLHRRLHALPAPDWLPTFASHPAFASGDASAVRPAPPAASDTIVHLDLHPDNVILSPSGPVVIDWKNARRGDGAIDIAATWVIMATSEIDGALVQRTLADVMRRLFVAAFLRHVDHAAAVRQLPVMAHYRLLDRNLRPSERPAIRALLRREGV